MKRRIAALMFAIFAAPVSAQQWTVTNGDDGGYAGAFVTYPGLDFGLNCAARSVRNVPLMDTMWFETTVAPPWHFQITASEKLIPLTSYERSDLVLIVGQTGYRLPTVGWNEMEGGWQVDLLMVDPAIESMRWTDRLVLQIGAQLAWELPVTGLGAAIEEARQFCAATWIATGYQPPPGFGAVAAPPPTAAPRAFAPGTIDLPVQIQAYADNLCDSRAVIDPSALQAGDLDIDGRPDVVMNWRDVACVGTPRNLFCGAANCSIDVFMSSRGYANPVNLLGTSVGIGVHRSGRPGLSINGTFGLCGENGCTAPWIWTGSDLEQVP